MKKIALAMALLGLSVTTFAAKEPRTLVYTCTANEAIIGREKNGNLVYFRSGDMPVWDISWNPESNKFGIEKRTDYYKVSNTMTSIVNSLAAPSLSFGSHHGLFKMDKQTLRFVWTDISAFTIYYFDATVMVSGSCEIINYIAGNRY